MSAPEEKRLSSGKEKKSKKEGKKNSDAKPGDIQSPPATDTNPPDKPEKEIEKIETQKSELEKSPVTNENTEGELSFTELLRQNLIRQLMKDAGKKSEELKIKILSQLNEVFKLFDIDRNGIIDETDLKFTFSSLGEINVPEEKIKNMINESPTPIDFATFVGLFESKEMEFDPEFDLIRAFSKWDSKGNGLIQEERLRNDLMRQGDRFSEKDAYRALEEAPVYDEKGEVLLDYIELCANICGLQNVRASELYQEKFRSSSKK